MMDHTKNQEKLVELAYSRSSSSLQVQATIANSSDQRALVFSTLSVAAAALVYGALKDGEGANLAKGSAMFFCFSATCCATSALPGRFYGLSSKLEELKSHIDDDTQYIRALLGLCQNNDQYIENNEKSAQWRAHAYRFAVVLFLIGIAIAVAGFLKG